MISGRAGTAKEDQIIHGVKGISVVRLLRENMTEFEDLHLVGGAIRDLALGRVPAEFDFVAGRPAEAAGKAAGLTGSRAIKLGKGNAVIYRVPVPGGGLDFSELAEASIDRDLRRRDFTVNSLAVSLRGMTLADPLGGLPDLQTMVLRESSPRSMEDDPLRIVKAYRMRAVFPGLAWDPATRDSCRKNARMLGDVAAERIQAELAKAAAGITASQAFREMAEDRVLFELFPDLENIAGLGQSAPHRTDVLSHTLDMLRLLDEELSSPDDPLFSGLGGEDLVKLRLAILFHDAGKAACMSRDGGRIRFLGHERSSAEIASRSMSRLRFSNAVTNDVASLCILHMRPLHLHGEGSPSVPARRRLIRDAAENSKLLLLLSLLDFSSMERAAPEKISIRSFCIGMLEMIDKEGERIMSPPKLLDGLRAMSILGLEKPGPELGRALLALSDAQTDGYVGTADDAAGFLEEYRETRLKG
ncbi:MAG TPA: HD domain-containing protein [Acidobacteriota bacterium]|nr:HD domain-containing protein [Acidobacteriota bacterium]HNT17096.1 HD domain-containing protein [Acidobacteriota bacterium]HPA26108.1 HD domain-containing protein [Acidobacteriota bacterium]HQO19259.1 HD domain-containing protein [Acidobacteriota bacterium]HQQ46071.1 HD domain-containing protein [Acidobacteriota bacterium]